MNFLSIFKPKVIIRYVPMRARTQWTANHAMTLGNYLESEFGKVLVEHMEGWQAEANAKIADPDSMSEEYKRGIAYGVKRACGLITQYSQYTKEVEPEFTDKDIEDALRNRFDRVGKHEKFVL